MSPYEWLLSGDTGISSKTIFGVMTGTKIQYNGYPRDPGDFGRCHRLLEQIPEWRSRLPEVASKYPEWAALVREWETLTTLYLRELDNDDDRAPELYARMQELIDEGRLAAGWVRESEYCWRAPDGTEETQHVPGVTISSGA